MDAKQIIIGIDPGSRATGYGIIQSHQQKYTHITHGTIRAEQAEFPDRLHCIHQSLLQVLNQFQPTMAAIEQVFNHRNPSSALKLGQARGAAIVALTSHGLNVAEYSAKQVKNATVGYGAASKIQMQHMIKTLLQLPILPQSDAADALAIALCHASCYKVSALLARY